MSFSLSVALAAVLSKWLSVYTTIYMTKLADFYKRTNHLLIPGITSEIICKIINYIDLMHFFPCGTVYAFFSQHHRYLLQELEDTATLSCDFIASMMLSAAVCLWLMLDRIELVILTNSLATTVLKPFNSCACSCGAVT